MKARGLLATARILTYWDNSWAPRPAAQGTVEEAFADFQAAYEKGDWLAVASYFEGGAWRSWELNHFVLLAGADLGPSAYLTDRDEDALDASAPRRSEAAGMQLLRGPGGEARLSRAGEDPGTSAVFVQRNETWYIGPPTDQAFGLQLMGGSYNFGLAQILASFELLGRGLRDGVQVDSETMQSQMGVVAFEILALLDFGSAEASTGSGDTSPRCPQCGMGNFFGGSCSVCGLSLSGSSGMGMRPGAPR